MLTAKIDFYLRFLNKKKLSSLASRRNISIVIEKTRLIYFNMTCTTADPFCVSRLSKVYATSMKLLCNCIVIPIQQYTKVRDKYACNVRHVRHIVSKQGRPSLAERQQRFRNNIFAKEDCIPR